jgi:hypothetical protein
MKGVRMKKKYFAHLQHLVTGEEIVKHFHTANISAFINTLGIHGWHAIFHRLAGPNDKENFANGSLRKVNMGA